MFLFEPSARIDTLRIFVKDRIQKPVRLKLIILIRTEGRNGWLRIFLFSTLLNRLYIFGLFDNSFSEAIVQRLSGFCSKLNVISYILVCFYFIRRQKPPYLMQIKNSILKTTEVLKTSVVWLYYDQSKSTIFPSSFHFAGTGVSIQSNGLPTGSILAADVKHFFINAFCSAPTASGCADINKGVPLWASN